MRIEFEASTRFLESNLTIEERRIAQVLFVGQRK